MVEFKRVGSLTDFNTIELLAKEIWNEHYTPIIGKDQVNYMLEAYQSFKAIRHQVREGAKYFLILHEEESIGYLSFEVREDDAFMSKVYVKSDKRRLGIGAECVKFLQEFSKEQGLRAISLTVNRKNKVATDFYKKNGFEIIEEVVADIGGGFVMDDYVMRKAI